VETLRRSRLSAPKLWAFIKNVLRFGNKSNALRALKTGLSVSAAYRIWKRFIHRQSYIRTALAMHHPPPRPGRSRQPVEETIEYLEAAFPDACNPLSAFQEQLQIAFL